MPEELHPEAPYDLVRELGASISVLGPLVARCGRARVALPGGQAEPRPRLGGEGPQVGRIVVAGQLAQAVDGDGGLGVLALGEEDLDEHLEERPRLRRPRIERDEDAVEHLSSQRHLAAGQVDGGP